MRRARKRGNFFLTLLFNLLLNLEWTIPAWILLACHYLFDWSIKWFWLALALWVVYILLCMKFMGLATRWGNIPDRPKENKNPYSVKSSTDTQHKK